jgi:hypothetical protein
MKSFLQWHLIVLVGMLIASLLEAGCSASPVEPIKPLTEGDKKAMVEIALEDPEVSKWLENGDYTTEAGWVVIAWENHRAVGWYRVDYDDIKEGTPPKTVAYVTDTVTINPEIYIQVGQPVRMFISIIFNSERNKVLSIELQPGRPNSGPS